MPENKNNKPVMVLVFWSLGYFVNCLVDMGHKFRDYENFPCCSSYFEISQSWEEI